MFSTVIISCLAAACVFAAPAPTDVVPLEKQQPTVIPIVSQSEELETNGTYKFSYETGNGIKREETSYDKVIPKVEGRSAAGSSEGGESNESDEIHVQRGSYSYTAPDGTLIKVSYIADENGFRPVGDHIPQSIVAAAAAAGSSGEKSGRALDVGDSVHSASAPAAAAAPVSAPAPKSVAPKPAAVAPKPAAVAPSEAASKPAIAAPSEGALAVDAAKTTESASEALPSTTESASTSNAINEASPDASEGTTQTAEATTKAADATTEAASETPEAPSSTSAESATTEAASTTAAASTASA